MKHCWLCEYSDDPLARNLAQFMTDQSVTMGADLMSERVHEALVESCPEADGIGLEEVREHIMTHTLHPGVRVACMMRSLLRLVNKLEGVIMANDPETGEMVVDSKSLSAYLKVTSEVMSMYRTGEVSKLLFSGSADSKQMQQ
jgi:hypothetical protein